jgi:DNA-binding XRE family transcriptional regulator
LLTNVCKILELGILILNEKQSMDSKELHQAEGKIGQRLRQLRLERSLTQEELATLAGTKQAVIQKIENLHSKRPRVLADLAVVLEVNPAWLQWGEPYADRQSPMGNS